MEAEATVAETDNFATDAEAAMEETRDLAETEIDEKGREEISR